MSHNSDASVYRRPCGALLRVFPADPAALASLLGSNYQFLFLIFPGWSVTFSSWHKFYPWGDEVRSFNLSFPGFLPFLIQGRQGLWGLFFFFPMPTCWKWIFVLCPLSALVSVLAGHTFSHDSWWPQSPSGAWWMKPRGASVLWYH